MAGVVTKNFRIHVARQFKEQLNEAAPDNIYFFIARTRAWNDDNNPPTPLDTTSQVEFDVWRNMIAMKRVTASDASYAVPRIDWTANTVYNEYTSNTTYHTGSFYVLTEDYNVYKCLFNDGGANSTVKPSGTSNSVIQTADSYKWKYMYSISAADALKFLTTTYMPVSYLASDDGSLQWDVQASATNTSIDVIDVTNAGSGYLGTKGTLSGVTNSSIVALSASANTTDDVYNGSELYIYAGTSAGEKREIVNYVGSTKTATLATGFSTTPDVTSQYNIGPKVTISGDGAGASAYANTTSGGGVNKVIVISTGNNYSYANVAFTSNGGAGSFADAYISVNEGHGANAVNELFGHNIMFNVKMTGTESNTFMVGNDFRVIGLVANPLIDSTGAVANASTYRMTTKLNLASNLGTFSDDEVVTGATSGATGIFVEHDQANVINVIRTSQTVPFSNGEIVTGGTSGSNGTISLVTDPLIRKYAGEVLYIENRTPITRASGQQEDSKIVIRF